MLEVRQLHVTRGGTPKQLNKLVSVSSPAQTKFSCASDKSGNYYELEFSTGTISITSPAGVQIGTVKEIGQSSGEAIAVNTAGDIFVIDNQRLKLIKRRTSSQSAVDLRL